MTLLAAQADSVTVTPGAHYAGSGLRRFVMGSGYRDLWATPICVAVADLDRLGGGLTPLRQGGGATTETLHLMGADGRRYVLRSVEKRAGQGLPEELRGTLYEAVLQDQISAFMPTGAVVVSPLLEAVGVLHTEPRLVYVPDSPRLGQFRETFARRLAVFEERPDDREGANPGFGGATRVTSTARLFEHLRESPTNRVDARSFLAARLVDLLVGDRDRSVNNWLWARFDTDGGAIYRPIPRDRDQSFIRLNGALKWYLRFWEPRLVAFSETYPSVTGLTRNAWDMDRPLLIELEREDWDGVVASVRAALTDVVIDSAVSRLPSAHREAAGAALVRGLTARRDRLAGAAAELYEIVNRTAEIHATDVAEVATLIREPDGTLSVTIAAADDPASPWFRRTFRPADTREVRLYLLGGDDSVSVEGAGNGIAIRVIGGRGRDRYVDRSTGGAAPAFYDGGNGSVFVTREGTQTRADTFEPSVSWGETAAETPDWGSTVQPVTGVPWRGDLGFFPRGGLVYTKYGLRRKPYLARQLLAASYTMALSRFLIEYEFDRVIETDRMHVSLDAYWSGVELIRYYGLGNDTKADAGIEFYRVHHRQASIAPSIDFTRGPIGIRLGAYARRSVTDTTASSLIATKRPYGSGTFSQVGATIDVRLGSREDALASAHGVNATTSMGWTPAVLSVDRGAFASITGTVTAWVSAFNGGQTLAARAGGKRVTGEFPIHDAVFIGGPDTFRGSAIDRYAGDGAAWGSVELRSHVARLRFLFPDELGTVLFADAGRTFVDGGSPGGWHTGWGGGVWIAPVSRSHTIRMTVARGRDYTSFQLAGGFAF